MICRSWKTRSMTALASMSSLGAAQHPPAALLPVEWEGPLSWVQCRCAEASMVPMQAEKCHQLFRLVQHAPGFARPGASGVEQPAGVNP